MIASNTFHIFSSFIIGEGTLPIRCAEILLERGQLLYGMISSDSVVKDWARDRGIPCIEPNEGKMVALLSQRPFDYLFSIVNLRIVPTSILALPRCYAINYHDAPLPRYAGFYATSWAILQGERMHGITWHVMTEQFDAGDIVQQERFEIADTDTAFLLSTKCHDVAISTFAAMVDDLSHDTVRLTPQNPHERTVFARDQRPPLDGVLSWQRSAREISALVRALDFGPLPNPLGSPKLALEADFLIVPEIEVLAAPSPAAPGTITQIATDRITVATVDNEVALHTLLTIDGQALPVTDVVAKYGWYEGYQFKELDEERAARLLAYDAAIHRHEAFWVRQLAAREDVALPYAHQKPVQGRTTDHAGLTMRIPPYLLNTFAQHHAAWNGGDFLLTAFTAYLARLGEMGRFALDYADSERRKNVAGLEGCFAAQVPVCIAIEREQGFEEVFPVIQQQFHLVRQKKTYTRDVMVRYPLLRTQASRSAISVERVEMLRDYQPGSEHALTVVMQDDAAECLWVYDAAVFDEDSVVAMQRGFLTFLRGIAANPQQRIAEVPLLTEAERERLLVKWNATQAAYPEQRCLHELFEEQVQRTPDAVAAVFQDQQLTYQQLNQRANQLAHLLRERGVGPEVLVGLCVERSLEMLVGLLGILKAGGAYVPLDPAFPTERIAFMLQDAGVPVLVTQQHLLGQLPPQQAAIVCLDSDSALLAAYSTTNPVSEVTPEHLAYVIYTSGSTGRPKGVQIVHRAVVNFLWSMREQPGLAARDTLLAVTTLSFDIAGLELFLPLIVGARVIVATREMAADGAALAQALEQAEVTVMQATPVTWRLLLAAGWQGNATLKVLCGGEPLPPDLAQQLATRAASVWNLYGPTETTIWSTLCKIEPDQELISIGRPIANTQVYLLDAYLQPVPIGVPGELYIGGDGLARGYLRRPELTAERFLPHPFSKVPGTRLYKTGDLARYRADGSIEHLGRQDFQVKLRGFRIELGEIEAVLGQHPVVQQAVVVAREDVPGDQRLVAYVVPRRVGGENAKTSPLKQETLALVSQLRILLKERLPDYMIPATIMVVETLPLTPNGKVDRKALPVPDVVEREQSREYVAPRTDLEERLAGIWAKVLRVEQVSIHDNFIELGGHSLLALQIIARVRKTFQIELPLSVIFKSPTIAELAMAVEARIIEELAALDEEEAQSLVR